MSESQAAHTGLGAWSALSGTERAAWLRKLAVAVEAKREPLMQLEAINTGRTINEMEGDLDDTGAFFEYWADMAEKLDAKQGEPLDAPSGYEVTMRYDAAGVAACILPFNWPLVNVVLKLGPALAAGCCVVLKPSEYTPLTTLAFAKVVQEIDFPAGVINVVTGFGKTSGAALTTHPGVSVVGFTGSVATGCQIARDAQQGDAAKHVFAEMGGKSAAIVLDDVAKDPERFEDLIDWIMFGVFLGNGQACSATSRLLLHSAVAPLLLPRLIAAVEGVKIGDNSKLLPSLEFRDLNSSVVVPNIAVFCLGENVLRTCICFSGTFTHSTQMFAVDVSGPRCKARSPHWQDPAEESSGIHSTCAGRRR